MRYELSKASLHVRYSTLICDPASRENIQDSAPKMAIPNLRGRSE